MPIIDNPLLLSQSELCILVCYFLVFLNCFKCHTPKICTKTIINRYKDFEKDYVHLFSC